MYIEAMNKFNSNNLDEALIIFDKIERLYPLSNEAIQSQIMSGFIDYGNLYYDDAIYKFSKIINKYPSLKNIDYVYYMRALCYYEQISNEELDGKNNDLALEYFNQLIKRFPNSNYAKDARQKIVLVNSNIAAINRCKYIIENYPNSASIPDALHLMARNYEIINATELAKDARKVLNSSYPDHSPGYSLK